MKKILKKHLIFWKDKTLLIESLIAFSLFIISLAINYFSNIYAYNHSGVHVSDIFLNILPLINVDLIFIEGALLFFVFVIFILISEPKRIPFVIKSLSLFIVIRSFFIILTNIGPYPDSLITEYPKIITAFSSGSDLFFSGHAGIPFLLALIFWKNKYLKIIFLTCSIIAGIAVLFGHLHYSIDVFAAYFITYTIFQMSKKLFRKDLTILERS